MFEGLWTVEFASAIGLFGRGVIVITKDKKILGGDAGYYYSGSFNETGNKINGIINITRFAQDAMSILGDIDTFALEFNAEIHDGNFDGNACLQGQPQRKVGFRGIKRERL